MKLAFTVQGSPVSKQRPRLGRGGRVFTPTATLEHEARIGHAARLALPEDGWPMGADYAMEVRFYMGSQRLADVDNMLKAVCDGLNGEAFLDDVQVAVIYAVREIDTDSPRTEVELLAMPTSEATQWKRSVAYQEKQAKRTARRAAKKSRTKRATGATRRLRGKRRSR